MQPRQWLRSAMARAGIGLGFCFLAAASARGAAETSYTYVAVPQGSYTVGTNTVNVYLQETIPSGASYSVGGDGNLYAGAVALVEQAGGSGVTVTGGTNNTTSSPSNTNFPANQANFVDYNGSAIHVIDSLGNSNPLPNQVSPVSSSTSNGTTTNEFLLGTVTLNVAAGANATFSVESLYDANGDNLQYSGAHFVTVTPSDTDLDAGGSNYTGADAAPNSLVVSVPSSVPEPASIAIFAAGAAGLLLRRSRLHSR